MQPALQFLIKLSLAATELRHSYPPCLWKEGTTVSAVSPHFQPTIVSFVVSCPQFVGTARADESAERVCASGVQDLWTPESHYRWARSRFGSSLSAMVHSVRPARFFVEGEGKGTGKEVYCMSREVVLEVEGWQPPHPGLSFLSQSG